MFLHVVYIYIYIYLGVARADIPRTGLLPRLLYPASGVDTETESSLLLSSSPANLRRLPSGMLLDPVIP